MATTTVIPTYRRPRLLARAIRSVLSQSYSDLEVHVYDNASEDETPEVVAALAARDSRVKYHRHAHNIGMMENFAFGISRVRTPFFSILSDDDFLLPGFLKSATGALSAEPSAGFFFGGLLFFDGTNVVAAPVEQWGAAGLLGPAQMFRAIWPGAWITWTSALFKTETVHRIGGLRLECGFAGDIDLLFRLAIRSRALVSPEPFAVMNLHHGSASVADGGNDYSIARRRTIRANVEQAILQARREGAITSKEASSVLAVMNRNAEWRMLRRGMALLAQGRPDLALKEAEALRIEYRRRDLASVLRLAAGPSPIGLSVAAGLRLLRRVRGAVRLASLSTRYEKHTTLAALVRTQLEAGRPEALGRLGRASADAL